MSEQAAQTSSRTAKSMKNIAVAVAFMLVNILLQFFARKVFLDRLGDEILGLNSTAQNLLQFLNLAELGIGAAVGFSLYKPLFDNDRQTIREIVALQGHLYRRIALVVIAGAVIMGCFFPLIFSKMALPLWYAYASFGVLLFSALLSYFVNYKEILLSADQKEYKIIYSFRMVMMLRLVVQCVLLWYLDNPYIWWLISEAGFTLLASIALNWQIRRTYPFLSEKVENPARLKKKFPTIVTKIKQVFFHKLSTYVLQQSSPLIIAFLASLTMVTYYTNYMYIVTGIGVLLNALFNGINAGVGNLVAEGDKKHILDVFGELFVVRFFICIVAAVCFAVLAQPFIGVWIGPGYELPTSSLLLICLMFFLNNNRASVDSFISAYGLFQDIWAPITEAALNLSLSIAFGLQWGLNGVLCGSLTSVILIVFIWKPIFLYRSGFQSPIGSYISLYARSLLTAAIAGFALRGAMKLLPPMTGTVGLIVLAIYVLVVFTGVLFTAMWFITPEIRLFVRRITTRFKSKG